MELHHDVLGTQVSMHHLLCLYMIDDHFKLVSNQVCHVPLKCAQLDPATNTLLGAVQDHYTQPSFGSKGRVDVQARPQGTSVPLGLQARICLAGGVLQVVIAQVRVSRGGYNLDYTSLGLGGG